MKVVENIVSGKEREFYSSKDKLFKNVTIDGLEDGESAFKECKNIQVECCSLKLRYPFWHNDKLIICDSLFYETCRAALWYSKDIEIKNSTFNGVKAFRECENISIEDCKLNSEEPFWKNNKITAKRCVFEGFYAFFMSSNISLKDIGFKGKYSFQYCNDVEIFDSTLDTKDAFWHAKNVIVKNCIVKGEYLGWYSENLTFINCEISGTQPLCYCKGLKIVNCTFKNCDLSFEYSEVDALIIGKIDSIKNPLKGQVICEKCLEYIKDEYDKSEENFKLLEVL